MSEIEIEDVNWQISMIPSVFIITVGLSKINLVKFDIFVFAKVQLSAKIGLIKQAQMLNKSQI